jgi:hypothetical protein
VLGLPFAAAFAISRRVERAIVGRRFRRTTTPLVASPELIEAQLDASFDHLLELTASGRDVADLDEAVAHACARAEEWTA